MKKISIILGLFFLLFTITGCEYLTNQDVRVAFDTYGGEPIEPVYLNQLEVLPTPVKEGYLFEGWFFDRAFTDPASLDLIDQSITLYALWSSPTVEVVFEDYDGTILKTQMVPIGERATAPEVPVRTGYRFTGWSEEFNQVTQEMTIQALYEVATFMVSFYNHEGVLLKFEEVNYGFGVSAPFLAEREGYVFLGWSEDFSAVFSHLQVHPLYEEVTYLVQFIDYDGTVLKEENVTEGSSATAPQDPVREGYAFLGWSKDFTNIQSNTIVIAKYSSGTFTVTYDLGYNSETFTQDYDSGNYAALPNQTRTAYIFGGWSKDGIRLESLRVYEDVTIVAIWVENATYTLSFDSRGGTSQTSVQVGTHTTVTTLPTPTKSGSEFVMWHYNNVEVKAPFVYRFEDNVTLQAVWTTPYYSNGTPVYYRNSTTQIQTVDTYVQKEKEFRGVWVSHIVGDISRYSSKEQMQNQLLDVLDKMVEWNMNAIVYHIRTHNDAYYPTELSPIASYVSAADFSEWDYLEWFIDECHKRGIEFHAWLNPYRIGSSTNLTSILDKYENYPLNPASKAENVLIGSSGSILNPGEPVVREFLVDTCMEIIEKYDVDAIHFDDYFYISTTADTVTYNKYKASSSTTNIEDWRREQVDIFIRDLSQEMRAYNQANNRQVELGISPSGVWRNGNGIVTYDENGTAITNGSNTAGMEHYGGYLYSDTKKWIDEEWIDYICPQTYWSFTQTIVIYGHLADWWAQVVRYKNVKLYTGMGIYMTSYGWGTNPYEASDQVLYNVKLPEVDGICIFRYGYIKSRLNENNAGTVRLMTEYWTAKVAVPE